MIRIKKIDHIVIRTANPRDLIDFYCEVLGCNIEREVGEEFGLTQLRAGECLIDIVDTEGDLGKMGGEAPTSKGNNMDHFCVQIQSIGEEELKSFLKNKNIKVGEFANRYGAEGDGRALYIEDPDGNTIELRPPKEKHNY